jgi:hypothetical protein
MSILAYRWVPRIFESLINPHFLQFLSNLLILFAFLSPSSQAAPSPLEVHYAWQFKVFAINKTPHILLNSTFCPTVGCQSFIFLIFDIKQACSVNCDITWDGLHESPKYLCLMSDQTTQYCRDPNWGGCPYWSCKYHWSDRGYGI